MQTVIYNGSFENFLTAVFEVYEYKIGEPSIQKEDKGNISLFGAHIVHDDKNKAERVIKKLKEKNNPLLNSDNYMTFNLKIQLKEIMQMQMC